MAHKLTGQGRRNVDFRNRIVKEALPEYHTTEYDKLVSLLQHYYDFMDSDETHGFDTEIHQLNTIRDIGETPEEYLNLLISELSNGLPNGDKFTDARKSARNFGDLYRYKGSRSVVEGFFRAFFQQEVEVEYPKKNMFIVGESKIGADSLRYIQDYKRYQILSILLKVALSTNQYQALYKKFAHPAGFYFEGEVLLEGEGTLGATVQTTSIADSSVDGTFVSEASITPSTFIETTGLLDSDGDATPDYRVALNKLISTYQNFTVAQLDGVYSSIAEVTDPNSFTFDDSATVSPDFSHTTETYDNNMFTRYTSDSTF